MSATKLTLKDVEQMSSDDRLKIPVSEARQMGLKVVDASGGGATFIGTSRQHQATIMHLDMPGANLRSRW